VAAGLGKLDLAFEYLDKAYEERDALMGFIQVYTPWVAPQLRADPRYKILLAKMKVTDSA
jgi:hypothetical protein